MKKNHIIILLLIILSFGVSAYFYPLMPDKIASHWNYLGEVDGYMTKFWGVFLIPVITAVMALLFLVIPLLDPLKANYEKFRKYYNGFIFIIILFMFVIQLFMLLWNIGIKISPNLIMPIGMGVLFYFVGIMTENSKMNWFIGIRTPWTLSSEVVWDKTNKLGGKLFKVMGLISLLAVFLGKYAFLMVLAPVILITIFIFAYSYFEFRKLEKK